MVRRPPFLILVLVFALVLLPARSARGVTVHIEAETLSGYHDISGCGYPISVVSCEIASGGYAVEGVDCNDEWIQLTVNLPSRFSFVTGLKSAGAVGYARRFEIACITDPGGAQVAADTLVTPVGQGVG